MTLSPPDLFWENTDWRRLSVAEGYGKLRFTTLKQITYDVAPKCVGRPISFRDGHGHEWLRICPHRILIPESYSWNGNSPKKGISVGGRDVWFGTPDFKPTIPASLIHDAFFQFAETEHFPFSLEQCNDFYTDICRANGFALTSAYSGALKDFSSKFFGRALTNGEHSVLL